MSEKMAFTYKGYVACKSPLFEFDVMTSPKNEAQNNSTPTIVVGAHSIWNNWVKNG